MIIGNYLLIKNKCEVVNGRWVEYIIFSNIKTGEELSLVELFKRIIYKN